MTNKMFKELKWEIKEKSELIENFKEIIDAKTKRMPDIDIKINEVIEELKRFEEQWLLSVREVAQSIDESAAQLSRTFIGPEERPFVGIPEPQIENIIPREISAEAAERARDKIVWADGTFGRFEDKEMEEFHRQVHESYLSGGEEIRFPDQTGTERQRD